MAKVVKPKNEFVKSFKKYLTKNLMLNEDAFRDFLREVAKGDYVYLVGKDQRGKTVVKSIENGKIISKDEVIKFLEKK